MAWTWRTFEKFRTTDETILVCMCCACKYFRAHSKRRLFDWSIITRVCVSFETYWLQYILYRCGMWHSIGFGRMCCCPLTEGSWVVQAGCKKDYLQDKRKGQANRNTYIVPENQGNSFLWSVAIYPQSCHNPKDHISNSLFNLTEAIPLCSNKFV